jgi:hypothetical protein
MRVVHKVSPRAAQSADAAYRLAAHAAVSALAETIRSRLVRIGSRVRRTLRRVWGHLAEGLPLQQVLARAHRAPNPCGLRLLSVVPDPRGPLETYRPCPSGRSINNAR